MDKRDSAVEGQRHGQAGGGSPEGRSPPGDSVALGHMTLPRVSPAIPMDALYLAVISAGVEPQVPKAPAAPEADVPPDSSHPVSPVQHRQDLYG